MNLREESPVRRSLPGQPHASRMDREDRQSLESPSYDLVHPDELLDLTDEDLAKEASIPCVAPRRVLSWLALVPLMFLEVGGGLGIEETVKTAGPMVALASIAAAPLLISTPLALVTAELSIMFPENGGLVLWADRALGPFWGFVCGSMAVLASVVDVATLIVLVSCLTRLVTYILTPTHTVALTVDVTGV